MTDRITVILHMPLAAACVASVLSFAVLLVLLRTGLAWRIATDVPNQRSLHVLPTPRIGGWGVVPVSAGMMLWLAPQLWPAAVAALLLGTVSQFDDRRGLPARARFVAHVAAVAFVMTMTDRHVNLSWWFTIPLGVALVWLVNLYNFMDGSDGLAGGMAVFGFGTYALAASPHDAQLALAAAVVAGAAFGFLFLNFNPARTFLGDAGSIPLGLLAGAFGYWGWQHTTWPLWFAPMVFAPFIADASNTLLRRLLRGDRVWQAHREHAYQRLAGLTRSHKTVALVYYLLNLISSLAALALLGASPLFQWISVVAWYVVLVLIDWRIERRWQVHIIQGTHAN